MCHFQKIDFHAVNEIIMTCPEVISAHVLKSDIKFLVTYMQPIRSRFGGKLLLHLMDNGKEYSVFLPPLVMKAFYQDPQLYDKFQALLEKGKLCVTFRKPNNSIVEFGEL